MNIKLSRTTCCGLRIVNGMNGKNPKQSLIYICRKMFPNGHQTPYDAAFILFSDSSRSRSGNVFKQFILNNDLGTFQESIQNNKKVWIWEIQKVKLKKWYSNNK